MSGSRTMSLIVSFIFIVLMIIIISTGLFTVWLFFGMLILTLMYVFGYFFIVKYYYFMLEQEENEKQTKKKFDYCWERINIMLRKMPNGQGIEWAEGFGRRSELRYYNDGIQNRPFRSVMGYLARSQQLVVIIYDIDNDDLAKFEADPSPEVIRNPFSDFKPYQSSSMGVGGGLRSPYYNSRYPRRRKGVSIHVGDNNDFEDFESTPYKTPATYTDAIANDAIEKLKSKR